MSGHLRYALRQLAKAPAFAFAAVFTLALGIGSATTVFTAFNGLLLRPMPFIQGQDRMVMLDEALPAKNIEHTGIALADFLDWRARAATLDALWLYNERTAIITGRPEPVRRHAAGIGANAFQAMGVQPVLGRDFRPEEDIPGAPPVAILAHHTWKRDYGGADDIVGQKITLNGVDTLIIGVMPKGWRYPERADLWMPMQASPADAMRGHFSYRGHAMLKPGVSLDEARAEFAAISSALAREYPRTNDGVVAVLRPVRVEASGDIARLTLLLLGAVTFVFLIACGNVANLLLARASSRTKEIAVRLALGARRHQLIAQLLVESLVLALLGGIGGLILALWGVDLTGSLIPEEHHPFWLNFGFDWRVFAFAGGLSALASVIFGLVPAWQATRPELIDEIKEGSRGGGGARTHELRSALVIVEIALALVLLVGAGLMMRSFVQLHHTSPGFDPQGVLTFRVGFPPNATDDKDVFRGFFRDLMPRLAALPGASSAGATSFLPGIGGGDNLPVLIEGRPLPKSMADFEPNIQRVVTPEYFSTLRIPLRTGRSFNAQDDAAHPRVAIVDELFAKKNFPNQSALGQRIGVPTKADEQFEWMEIVGVVGTARRFFDRDETCGTCYLPHAQWPGNFMSVVLRVDGDPASYIPAVRTAVFAVNKDMPIYYEMSLTQAIERSDAVWIRKFFSGLFTAFAVVALLLASIGIHGVMAYTIAQRTQEIGMRMALGARPYDVIREVVGHALGLIGFGLAAGFVAAFLTTGLLSGNLYHISPRDPPTFALVSLLLATVALIACWLPTRRATLIDPNSALRAE